MRRQPRYVVITGSDTGVGKTVLTAWLTRRLRAEGVNAVALKPICSGGRADARALHRANGRTLDLDEVNPWHFPAALAPVLAAQQAGRRIQLNQVMTWMRTVSRAHELVLVEGAGGLLSPLGEGFDTRELVRELNAIPVVVVPNRLGAVNQARLVIEALPDRARSKAQVVFAAVRGAGPAARWNPELLQAHFPKLPHTLLPWVTGGEKLEAEETPRISAALAGLVQTLRE